MTTPAPDPTSGDFTAPVSPHRKAAGMRYFPRMLDKIRLHARGALSPDYHANLGHGADGWCLDYLRTGYDLLRDRVLAGGTDEEILDWCFDNGRRLNKGDIAVWNQYIKKVGWNDFATPTLEKLKAAYGLAHRDDIVTLFQLMEADEGRLAAPQAA